MKTLYFLLALVFTMFLSGCTNDAIPGDWNEMKNAEIGISFSYPPEYKPSTIQEHTIAFYTGSILIKEVLLQQSRPIAPFIRITRSTDPLMIANIAQYSPLDERDVGGYKTWHYIQQSMAEPEGYIFADGAGWIDVQFIGQDVDTIDRVIHSVKIGPDIWMK